MQGFIKMHPEALGRKALSKITLRIFRKYSQWFQPLERNEFIPICAPMVETIGYVYHLA